MKPVHKVVHMKMSDGLELRAEILDMALQIEAIVDSILVHSLSLNDGKRKAITNRSGSLSFKNKIDLLFDLEIFTKDEHRDFLALSEVRNQFIHNAECSNFTKCVEILGADRGAYLCRLASNDALAKEDQYSSGYAVLFQRNLAVATKKLRRYLQLIESKTAMLEVLFESIRYFIDLHADLAKSGLEQCVITTNDTPEVMAIKSQLAAFLMQQMEKPFAGGDFQKLSEKLNEHFDSEKIKQFMRGR